MPCCPVWTSSRTSCSIRQRWRRHSVNVLHDYYATLERYRLLTYGQQVVRAVRELENPALAAQIHTTLRH